MTNTPAPRSQISRPPTMDFPAREVVLLDKSDPRAMINLVPETMAQAIEDLAFENPEYLNRAPRDLQALFLEQKDAGILKPHQARIGVTENQLRVAFWLEYNRAQDAGAARMNVSNIVAGVCTREYLEKDILRSKTKLAWLLTPPVSYTNTLEEALVYGIEKIRDILDLPLKDSKGNVSVKAAEVLLKTVQFLDARVKGAIVQRVDLRSLSVSANMSQPKDSEPMTLESVQKQLAQLELKAQEILRGNGGPPVGTPVEPIEVEALPGDVQP